MSSRKSSSKSNKTLSVEESIESDIAMKLRRLKIEENVLSKGIGKTTEDLEDEIKGESDYLDSKTLFNKLKVFYIDIRDLFEELKVNTSTEDNLQSLDIEEVKKTVSSIEVKMKRFKTFLKTELKMLKNDEQELTKELNEIPDEIIVTKEEREIQNKPFTEIVPSPVKVLINSPFKCQEVQEFQDFLSKSKNQYGGWILYNHNIFENCWQKYFNTEADFEQIQSSQNFKQFIEEVRLKTCDTNLSHEDVVLHSIWYSKYLTLKERQQKALEKWKIKKQLFKKSFKKQNFKSVEGNKSNKKLSRMNSNNVECLKNNESFSKNILNELFSDKFKNFNEELNDQILRCLSAEEENLENLIQDAINLDVSASGSATIFSEVQMVEIEDEPKEPRNLEAKEPKSDLRQPMAYALATEQWIHRCNDAGHFQPSYMDVETLKKRRIPEWRSGLYAKQQQ